MITKHGVRLTLFAVRFAKQDIADLSRFHIEG